MFVIQTRNYILKCVNSLVLFTEMACDKNQTYLQPPDVRPISDLPIPVSPIPDSPYKKYLQEGESRIGRTESGWNF